MVPSGVSMRIATFLLLGSILAAPAPAMADALAAYGNGLDLARNVQASRLRRTVERLVAFGTRHSLSVANSDSRGIGAARHWLYSEMQSLAAQPGSRLVPFEDVFTAPAGPRVPQPTEMANVGMLLPGLDPSRAQEAVVVTGHYDSRANDILDATSDAPGANDDGSGVALLLEMANVMATDRNAVTIYFVATCGEEQGLLGAARLAQGLKARGIRVLGMVAADCVGNVLGPEGTKDTATARLFSEGAPASETPEQRRIREALGGDNDSPSRELARYLKRVGERYTEDLRCRVLLRRDRIGRGGDHLAFNQEGFPAVRITEGIENLDRQHQVPRVEGRRGFGDSVAFFESGYCARITRCLVGAFHALAAAPRPPSDVVLVSKDNGTARLNWTLADARAASVVVYRRAAEEVAWQESMVLPPSNHLELPMVADNFFFAVAVRDRDGNESLPVTPVRAELP
jgi:hypothetical protein